MTLSVKGSNVDTGTGISSLSEVGTLWNTPGPVVTFNNNQASSGGFTAGGSYLNASSVMLPSSGAWDPYRLLQTEVIPGQNSTFDWATLWLACSPVLQLFRNWKPICGRIGN